MAITHSTIKASGERGYATEWNADHMIGDEDKSKRAATIIIAAADSLDKTKADYVCDGTADNADIQDAIDALPATGGRILLLDGTYNIEVTTDNDSITINKPYVKIQGQGHSTLLRWDNSALTGNVFKITSDGYASSMYDFDILSFGVGFINFAYYANGANYWEMYNISSDGTFVRIFSQTTCDYIDMHNITALNSEFNIEVQSGERCRFTEIRGISVDMWFTAALTKSLISGNNVYRIRTETGTSYNLLHGNITNLLPILGTGNVSVDNQIGW